MKIILKNSFKNIFKKPLRTLLMTFTIFLCVVSGLFCIDIGNCLDKLVAEMFGSICTADLTIESERPFDLPEDMPEHKDFTLYINQEYVYTDIESDPAFVNRSEFTIYDADIKAAHEMEFVDFDSLGDDEIAINSGMAKRYGYKEGDVITLHDRAEGEHEFKVKEVITTSATNPVFAGKDCAIINLNAGDMLSCGVRDNMIMFVKLTDDADVDDTVKFLEKELPRASVSSLALSKEDTKSLNDIKMFLYIIFAVSFLLVIFVTISISERIVSERMSFIGTLRSLGMSSGRTCSILLLENILYALIGAIPGILFYLSIRGSLLSNLLRVENNEGVSIRIDAGPISIPLVIGVFVGALLIECLIPLRAVIKALKTSIRDIIFDNRDTEYKSSKKLTVAGLVLLAAAIITGIFSNHLVTALICIVSAVSSAALLFPAVLIRICDGLKVFFDKIGRQRWALAAVEAKSRKSSVGSGIMCITASALCMIIYAAGMAELNSILYKDYAYDVKLDCSGRSAIYSFIDHIDGVTSTEKVYDKTIMTILDDDKDPKNTEIIGMPEGGFKLYGDLKGLPSELEEGTVYITKRLGGIENIKVGDTIRLTIDPDGVIPFEREYKVGGYFEDASQTIYGRAIVIPEEDYISMFHDVPGSILVKCDDPEKTSKIIRTYGKDAEGKCFTAAELQERASGDSSGIIMIITLIIIMGISMTLIGVVSNQIIGFEGRKKECAVMLSTAMNKRTLSGILLRESFIVSIVAGTLGTILGVGLVAAFKNALEHTESLFMNMETDPKLCLIFCIILVIIYTFTVLFPIRNLRRMKIAEQIKYE